MSGIVFRDDDLNLTTSVWLFKRVNDLFKKYDTKHHCAVLFENIFDNYELTHLLVNEKNITINFHGFTHLRYGELPYEKVVRDIKKSLEYWNKVCQRRYGFIKPVIKAFPTWHCTSATYEQACKDCGLEPDARKEIFEGVYVFHYWTLIEENEFNKMEELLKRESEK